MSSIAAVCRSEQRRLEVDKTRKRDVQTGGGGAGGPREATVTLALC
jgi:hypothetical protein